MENLRDMHKQLAIRCASYKRYGIIKSECMHASVIELCTLLFRIKVWCIIIECVINIPINNNQLACFQRNIHGKRWSIMIMEVLT